MRAVFLVNVGVSDRCCISASSDCAIAAFFAQASIKITIIVGALVLVFVFLFIIPAMLTMIVRASL